jgi:N-methylhydantoinase B
MRIDPTELEIFKNLYHSITEEMGAALRRSSFSPNIKERRDYSCAVFDGAARVVAMGDHMPVHLGSMPISVAMAIGRLSLGRGDIAIVNDPYAGGTHLPDITFVMPVFLSRSSRPMFYVANRAHHSDIGGAIPASMGLTEEIYQEGLRIPPVLIARGGELQRDMMAMLLANVRTPREREGDITAQIAACRLGERRLTELVGKYGQGKTQEYLDGLQAYSASLMRSALARIPDGVYRAEDFLDDDGFGDEPVPIRVSIRIRGRKAFVDFAGNAPACRGSVNAVFAITYSCVFYVFRCLLGEDVPACAGLMAPIDVVAPEGSVVNARPPAAVSAGNVETSQRIVDVLLRALAKALPDTIPAASQGTMNNVSFGGIDPRTGEPFAYYETIAGGMGAGPKGDGLSAVHSHMTNSLNTPVEAFESAYPVRVRTYTIRRNSGGTGKHRGGDGVIREIEFLTDVRGTILSERRRSAPYGLHGGQAGKPGRNELLVARDPGVGVRDSGRGATKKRLPSKATFAAPKGSTLRIETPGGGGWGRES